MTTTVFIDPKSSALSFILSVTADVDQHHDNLELEEGGEDLEEGGEVLEEGREGQLEKLSVSVFHFDCRPADLTFFVSPFELIPRSDFRGKVQW